MPETDQRGCPAHSGAGDVKSEKTELRSCSGRMQAACRGCRSGWPIDPGVAGINARRGTRACCPASAPLVIARAASCRAACEPTTCVAVGARRKAAKWISRSCKTGQRVGQTCLHGGPVQQGAPLSENR